MAPLRRRVGEDPVAVRPLVEPARRHLAEHPTRSETPAGDDQHAAQSALLAALEEAAQSVVRLRLGEPVQVEPRLDRKLPARETQPGAPVEIDRTTRIET